MSAYLDRLNGIRMYPVRTMQTMQTIEEKKDLLTTLVLAGGAVLVAGMMLGYITGKRK